MKTYEFADAEKRVGDLAFALNANGLYTPAGKEVFPGHTDWVPYACALIEDGHRPGIVVRADRSPCAATVFDQEPNDPRVIGLKYLWVSPDDRGRGVADALLSLTLGEIGRIWPEAVAVTGYAKMTNRAVGDLATRHGFKASEPQIRASRFGTNGKLDIIYTKYL